MTIEDDVETVRRALMLRDAGYDVGRIFDWEALGRMLKDYDRLKADTLDKPVTSVLKDRAMSVAETCRAYARGEKGSAGYHMAPYLNAAANEMDCLRAALAETEKTIECNQVALKEAGHATTQLRDALAEAEWERDKLREQKKVLDRRIRYCRLSGWFRAIKPRIGNYHRLP